MYTKLASVPTWTALIFHVSTFTFSKALWAIFGTLQGDIAAFGAFVGLWEISEIERSDAAGPMRVTFVRDCIYVSASMYPKNVQKMHS